MEILGFETGRCESLWDLGEKVRRCNQTLAFTIQIPGGTVTVYMNLMKNVNRMMLKKVRLF